MPRSPSDDIVSDSGLRLPAHGLSWRFSRSGGPGGQHVNTSDTRVELIADLETLDGPALLVERVRSRLGDSLRVVASGARSQHQNREDAGRRLAERLEQASRENAPRRSTRPGRGAVEARLREKHQHSALKASRQTTADEE